MYNQARCADGRKWRHPGNMKSAYTPKEVKQFAKLAGIKLSDGGKPKSKARLCMELSKNPEKKPSGLSAYPAKYQASIAAKMKASGRPLAHYSKTTGNLLTKYARKPPGMYY